MVRKFHWESLRDVSDTFPFIKAKEREFGTHTRGEHSGFKNKSTVASWILGEKNPDLFLPIHYLTESILGENVCGKQKSKGLSL